MAYLPAEKIEKKITVGKVDDNVLEVVLASPGGRQRGLRKREEVAEPDILSAGRRRRSISVTKR
jgi:hypothetical protein